MQFCSAAASDVVRLNCVVAKLFSLIRLNFLSSISRLKFLHLSCVDMKL